MRETGSPTVLPAIIDAAASGQAISFSDFSGFNRKTPVVGKGLWVVAAVLAGASAWDVETTFRATRNCPAGSCEEANPAMRPFINAGRPATYAVQGGRNAVIMYFSHRLKKSRWRGWWLPAVVGIGIHAAVGVHNYRLVRR
jgi:hypothetical protein